MLIQGFHYIDIRLPSLIDFLDRGPHIKLHIHVRGIQFAFQARRNPGMDFKRRAHSYPSGEFIFIKGQQI